MQKTKKIKIAIFIIFILQTLWGKSNVVGQNFYFLDARSKALSGISSTLTRSATVFLQNPANLALIRRPVFSINVNQLFKYDLAAITDYFPGIGGLGLAIGRLNEFNKVDFASIGWGKPIVNGLNLGISGVFYHQNETYSPEWQIGISYFQQEHVVGRYKYLSYLERFGFAAVLQHSTFLPKKFGPPLQFNLGIRYRTFLEILHVFAENQFRKDKTDFITAAELYSSSFLTLRSGLSNFDKNHFLFGFGVHLTNFNLEFVYQKYLEQLQFSCTIHFGESPQYKAIRYFENGKTNLKQNNIKDALSNFKKALIFNPNNESYRKACLDVKIMVDQLRYEENQKLIEAQYYDNNGQILAALVPYMDISEQYPDNELAKRKIAQLKPISNHQLTDMKQQAITTYENGDLINAKKIFERLYKVDPMDSTIQKYRDLINRTIKKQAEDHFFRALGYFSQKNFKAAKREFDIVYELKPSYPEIKIYLNDVKNQITINEKVIDSLFVIARMKRDSDNFGKLINIYNSILERDEQNVEALEALEAIRPKANFYISNLYSQAQLTLRNKDYLKTESLCEEILRINPNENKTKQLQKRSRNSRLNLAQELWQQGEEELRNENFDRAKDFFQKAIHYNRSKPEYRHSYQVAELQLVAQNKFQTAMDLVDKNEFNQAEKLIIELLEKYPERKKYQDLLQTFHSKKGRMVTSLLQDGIRLYSQNKLEEAIKKFEVLLKIEKENQTANDYKKRIQAKILALKKLK